MTRACVKKLEKTHRYLDCYPEVLIGNTNLLAEANNEHGSLEEILGSYVFRNKNMLFSDKINKTKEVKDNGCSNSDIRNCSNLLYSERKE